MRINSIKELRKAMRELDATVCESLIVDGFGKIIKFHNRYGLAPLPEEDDSDPQRDYSATSYGWREKWILDLAAKELGIE